MKPGKEDNRPWGFKIQIHRVVGLRAVNFKDKQNHHHYIPSSIKILYTPFKQHQAIKQRKIEVPLLSDHLGILWNTC